MPAFQSLRERGADLPSWTGMPSVSLPGYTTLGTGAYPDLSGVVSNWYDTAVRVDSLFAQAQEAGLRTALATMATWETLYGPWADLVYVAPWSEGHDVDAMKWTTEAIGEEALRILEGEDVALLYVHFGETDEAGHAYGGTSSEYLEAALRVDTQIGLIADALDWNHDTLVLTADHGMLAANRSYGGGHGGSEPGSRRIPLVLLGRGIRPGIYPEGGQADVAPTVAALLGIPIPAHNQGRIRLDTLVLAPDQRAEKAEALAEQQSALYQLYLRVLGAPERIEGLEEIRAAFAAGQHDRTVELVETFLDQLDQAVRRAAANRLWRDRVARLPYLIVPLLFGALYVGLYRRKAELIWPALFMLLFFGLYQFTYRVIRGFTLSFSAMGGLGEEAFFLPRTLDAVFVMLLLAILAGFLWRRRPWEEVVWGANQVALFVAWGLALQLGLFLWLYGLVVDWRVPHLGWGFKFYIDLLTAIGVGYAGLLFSAAVLGVSRIPNLLDRVRVWWGQWRSSRKELKG
jgi:hypothetical protein